MCEAERYEEKSPEELKHLYRVKYGDLTSDVKAYFKRTYQEALEMDEQARPDFTDKVARLMARMEVGNAAQLLFEMRYPEEAMRRMGDKIIASLREKAGIDCL